MSSSAKYVTHTLAGPIPHLPCTSASGDFEAPVKLLSQNRQLVVSERGSPAIRVGFPIIREHRFIHALPGGGEIPGEVVGYFEEQRLLKRQSDLLEFWNAQPHYTGT